MKGGATRWKGHCLRFAIPSTLHNSLIARLDRLLPMKEVAQTGAVIGREFSYELLAAVAPLQDGELRRALGRLGATRGLVFRRGEPPAAEYAFKHALVRDAAYKSLLKASDSCCTFASLAPWRSASRWSWIPCRSCSPIITARQR